MCFNSNEAQRFWIRFPPQFECFSDKAVLFRFSGNLLGSETEAAEQFDEREPHASSPRIVRIQNPVGSDPLSLVISTPTYTRHLEQMQFSTQLQPGAFRLCRKQSAAHAALKLSSLAAPAPSQGDIVSFAYKAISTLNAVTCV